MIKQKHIVYCILIITAVIALFLYNPWLLYFQNDDMVHIPLSRDGVLLQHNSFRPICDISIMMDYFLSGENAWGYHLTNLILHTINSILVYIVSLHVLKKYRLARDISLYAFAVAVLFWIYMNHSEAVFWILGRSAMLGMLFFLSACIFYFKRNSTVCFTASIVCSVMGWLSYESTWIIIPVFVCISFTDMQNGYSNWKKELKKISVISGLFLIYLLARLYFTQAFTGLYESGGIVNMDLSFIIANSVRLIIRSWLPPAPSEQTLIICFIILILLIAFTIAKMKNPKIKKAIVMFLILWVISLLPYITLGIDTKGVESERFLYLPSFFICVILVLIILQMPVFWKIIAVLIIYCANVFALAHHALQYRFAGMVVSNSIYAVNDLKNKNHLYAEGIPQENFGALIFRDGFFDGLTWLKNKGTIDSIIVLSQSHTDLPLQNNYPIIKTNDLSLIQDSVLRKHFTSDDVFFLYTNSALEVISK